MHIDLQLVHQPIPEKVLPPDPLAGQVGAWVEFRGIVRGQENGQPIAALEYEAYETMAVKEMRRILATLSEQRPVLAAVVIHRLGIIRAGEAAIYVGFAAQHRQPAFELLDQFMNGLKSDVPIWKKRALTAAQLEP